MWLSSVPAFFNHHPERPVDIRRRSRNRGPAGIEHDIPRRAQLRSMFPETFAEPAFDSVPHHRPADRARHGESKSRTTGFTWAGARPTESGEQRAGKAGTVVIDRSEIGGAQNASGSREWCATGREFRRLSQTGRLSRRSPSVCAGPGRGVARARPCHSWWPCASGTHASWRVFDYSAEMYVSA